MTEINVTDVMLGDWVLYEHKNTKWETVSTHYLKVVNITNDSLCMRNGEYWRVQKTGLGVIKPIPLTAEILENNGFINYDFEHIAGQHKWSWWRDTGTLVSLWCRELNDDPRDGWMVRIESYDANCCYRVESVHELQHALRLCGIEKEIIL